MKREKTAIIVGAGPAGLTAAYELIEKTDIKPVIYELSSEIGGISKTVNYKGNRIDIGGHRFFSKSDRVMQWWQMIMPIQDSPAKDDLLLGNAKQPDPHDSNADPERHELVMLIRNRLSRIYFLRKFFAYPVTLSIETLSNLGIVRTAKIGFSYLSIRLLPIKNEKTLEDFFINRFGRELYRTFFKDYTEKVWGVSCDKIKPEWGAQRIKGLSVTKALLHAIKSIKNSGSGGIAQKDLETSLVERFMYPKLGPGQLWEEVARIIQERGGELHLNSAATGIQCSGDRIEAVEISYEKEGRTEVVKGDYFFSTMPVKELIDALGDKVPAAVKEISEGLMYRDFVTVGLLLKKMKIKNSGKKRTVNDIIPDNWIYIQEPDVRLGRVQIFNNWSPYMVNDSDTVWLGLEYFCNEGDALWERHDEDFVRFAVDEVVRIGMIDESDLLDSVVLRTKKAYPAYFGSYDGFHVVRDFTDRIENLFLIGRNGMHRYNNQDHSMLSAMAAVENIVAGRKDKSNIWDINTEKDYHESKEGQ